MPRGADDDRRFEDLAAQGMDMHGEAALIDSYGPGSVLDAGCGTGRVAIELSRRGHHVVGIDVDEAMLAAARVKAPEIDWVRGDLSDPGLELGEVFDVVVMAGNVLIFVPSGSEERVIANAARWLRPGGLLVSGYSIHPGGFGRASTTPWPPAPAWRSRTAGRRGTGHPSPKAIATPWPCTCDRAERVAAVTQRSSNSGGRDALNVQQNPYSLGFSPWEPRILIRSIITSSNCSHRTHAGPWPTSASRSRCPPRP